MGKRIVSAVIVHSKSARTTPSLKCLSLFGFYLNILEALISTIYSFIWLIK